MSECVLIMFLTLPLLFLVTQAIKILNMIKLYDKPIRVNKSSDKNNALDVGANLFVGNLDAEVDEKLLYDTFSAFGVVITTPKIMRDPETSLSRGFGFVRFETFEASDAAIEAMNGQFLSNRPVSVAYAFKKDSRGVRHGTPAERLLAQKNAASRSFVRRPLTLFASAPGQAPGNGHTAPPPPPPLGMQHPPPPAGMMMGGPPPGMHMQPPPPPPGMMMGGPPPGMQHHHMQLPPPPMPYNGGQMMYNMGRRPPPGMHPNMPPPPPPPM